MKNYEVVSQKQVSGTKKMVVIGLFSALSYVLMLIHFPIKYLGFLELEFSDIPAIVAGIAYGPIIGVMIELIKNLIKLITATTTGGVGEFANFVVSIAYIIPVTYLYRKLSGKRKAIIAFSSGIVSMTVAGILINYFVTVPLYAKLFGGMEAVVGAASATIPAINGLGTVVILGITPFNIVKGLLISIVGYAVFKLFRKELLK